MSKKNWSDRQEIIQAMMEAKTAGEHGWLLEELQVWDIKHLDEIDTFNYDEGAVDLRNDDPTDAINPSHYKDIVPGYEYFDIMDHMLENWKGSQAHALGNALKYLMRLDKKDSVTQDLGKAIWYLERLRDDINRREKL